MQHRAQRRIEAAIVGCAVGDALGHPGNAPSGTGGGGRRTLRGEPPRFTGDTQQFLFVAEALMSAIRQEVPRSEMSAFVRDGLLRWNATQSGAPNVPIDPTLEDGGLITETALHRNEAPDDVALEALAAQHRVWASGLAPSMVPFVVNDRAGGGALIRSTCAALLLDCPRQGAIDFARLTHGHERAWMASAALAALVVALLTRGADAQVARVVERAIGTSELPTPVGVMLERAVETALFDRPEPGVIPKVPPDLGSGADADEALAIAIWSVLAYDDVLDSLAAASSHYGSTNTTTALAGLMLGLIHGDSSVFGELDIERIEALSIVRAMAARVAELSADRSLGDRDDGDGPGDEPPASSPVAPSPAPRDPAPTRVRVRQLGDEALFEALRAWRLGEAQARGWGAFQVCSNADLRRVVDERPRTLAELERISGFGAFRVRQFGSAILEVVASFDDLDSKRRWVAIRNGRMFCPVCRSEDLEGVGADRRGHDIWCRSCSELSHRPATMCLKCGSMSTYVSVELVPVAPGEAHERRHTREVLHCTDCEHDSSAEEVS